MKRSRLLSALSVVACLVAFAVPLQSSAQPVPADKAPVAQPIVTVADFGANDTVVLATFRHDGARMRLVAVDTLYAQTPSPTGADRAPRLVAALTAPEVAVSGGTSN